MTCLIHSEAAKQDFRPKYRRTKFYNMYFNLLPIFDYIDTHHACYIWFNFRYDYLYINILCYISCHTLLRHISCTVLVATITMSQPNLHMRSHRLWPWSAEASVSGIPVWYVVYMQKLPVPADRIRVLQGVVGVYEPTHTRHTEKRSKYWNNNISSR